MEGAEKELAMVKTMLRSVLMSSKEGVPAHVLQRDYREQTFEPLPFHKFGFRNLDDFILSMPDVVKIRHTPAGEIYHAVADESTAHISKMVAKQRSTKKRKSLKPARRRPAPRSAPFHSPWTAQQRIFLPPYKPWPGKRPPRSPQNRHHLTIHSEAGGHRKVNFSSQPRALTKAMDAANQQFHGDNLSRFEVPPRFRKRHEGRSPSEPTKRASPPRTMSSPAVSKMKPKKTSPKTQLQPIDPDILRDGKRYYDLLTKYCKTHHISDLKFETMPTRLDRMYCYTSTTKIHDRVHGSGGLFGSSVEAEFAACRTACVALGLLNESPVGSSKQSPTSVDEEKIVKSRVKEILTSKAAGMWGTRLPFEYKERFKEDPPGNILELVKSWKDVASVEFYSIAKVDIFYPVKDVPAPVQAIPAADQAIPAPVKDKAVLAEIPLPVQNSSQRKDFRIPQGEPLPLGVKVTVYTTFLHDVSYFCVQREDCPIEIISDELANLAQDPVPDEKDLTRGKFVAAMYSSDGTWSRAEIVSDKPSKSVIEVLFVDFGNEEECKTGDIRWLSEKSASYPVQTVYCSLYGIQPLKGEDDWSDELLTKFADLVKEEPLIAITQSYTDDGVCEVDLFLKEDKDISINQKLIDLGLVRALEEIIIEDSISDTENDPELLKLPDENEWDIYISFINQSSNSVVVRLIGEQYSEKFDEFGNTLEEAYENSNAECSIEEEGLYVALLDELYHRVRVLSIDGQMVECYFLDHGDTDCVPKHCLRALEPAVNKLLPYQAIEISLYGLEEIATNPTTLEKLLDLALGKTCVAEVMSRDDADGLSVILYDTGNDEDVNINEVIAMAVIKETEARQTAQGGFQPASVSLETSPVKGVSAKSVDIDKALNSLKLSPDNKKETSDDEIDEENNDSEGSWETEEEEEVVPAKKSIKKVTDKNSNTVKTSPIKNIPSIALTNVSQSKPKLQDTEGKSNTQSLESDKQSKPKSPEPEAQSIQKSPDSDAKNLYTWGKSGQEKELPDYMNDDKSLWVAAEYWKRPLPPQVKIPERGEYIDCHVSKVFDPTNFVCIPYASMPDFNQLLKDCIEYFNIECQDRVLKQDEIKLGHLYGGHQGGAWYRVLVNKNVGPGLVSVYIADFGEYNAMAIEEIKPLPWRFWQLPFQAFKCRLHGIKPINDGSVWSEGAKLKMKEMAQEKSLVGLVCGKQDDGFVSLRFVDTSTDEDICLDEVLLDLGMADVLKS